MLGNFRENPELGTGRNTPKRVAVGLVGAEFLWSTGQLDAPLTVTALECAVFQSFRV